MTAWAESKRFKRMMQRRIVFYLFLTMLSLSIVLPSFARKKQKKTKAVAVENNSTPLSYNDQRRFDYFFLEAVRQQNQGKFAAAFDLYRHCQEIDTNASVPYYQLARYQLTLGHDTLATELVEKALQKDAANPVYVEFLANQYIRQNRIREACQSVRTPLPDWQQQERDHRNADTHLSAPAGLSSSARCIESTGTH